MVIDNASLDSDAHCPRFAHCALDRRTVAETQGKVVGRRERNLPSRLAHAKNDKDIITTWKSDLGSFESSKEGEPTRSGGRQPAIVEPNRLDARW